MERSQIANKVTWIGFVVNLILTLFKIFAGITGKSGAMVADGVHSLSDFFTDIVVLVGFKFTEKPEDDTHNYGHGKLETVATVIIAVALFLVGFKILVSGISSIYSVLILNDIIEKPKLIALVAAFISIVVKELLYRYTKIMGEKINSSAVIANAWHHRSDAFSSMGTLIGISGAIILGDKWTILDPIASVIVSIFIFKVAFEIFIPAINELLECSLSSEENEEIKEIIANHHEIREFHKLRTRKIGSRIAIDVHLLFEESLTIKEVHEYAENIEKDLKNRFGLNTIINSHLEPLE